MRRIQIYLDENLDEALEAEAARSGRSKGAIIRECVAARHRVLQPVEEDPLTALVGSIDAEPSAVADLA